MYPVGVADVLGTGRPQVFVSSFECGAGSKAWLYGIWPDGNRHAAVPYLPHWPVGRADAVDRCYDQSIDFVGRGHERAGVRSGRRQAAHLHERHQRPGRRC